MSQLTTEEILKLAKLARLKLSDVELERYKTELEEILGYVEMLSSVDTDNLEPTNHVTGLVNVFRADEVQEYVSKPEELLKQTPGHEGRYIKVKRMI
jgi:aspartyl-tRNA(Asn)/glutamyl-tRNA(Gln) amidotransferase subunit C